MKILLTISKTKANINLFLRLSVAGLLISLISFSATAIGETGYISNTKQNNYFTLSESGKSAPLYIDSADYTGVIRALKDLQSDIGKVTGIEPALAFDEIPSGKEITQQYVLDHC